MFENLQSTVKVDDAAVEKYFNEHKSEFEVVKARHILIRVKGAPMQAIAGKPELTDEEALAKAQAIRKRILGGEDFATVAKAESDDAGSGAQGGDLGEFRKGMMVPPFETAAFAAKVGELTEPVKTPFGYHVIKVETHTTKSLADARPDIEKKLRPELASQSVAALRNSTTVQLDDSFFGPAAPSPVPPSPVPAR
jgi:parvulin-like peptidyl-prolyl isomerase